MSAAMRALPPIVDDAIPDARIVARQKLKARTAAMDALVRARDFLEKADVVATPEEGTALLRAMIRAGFRIE